MNYKESVVFDAVAIRDTAVYTSAVIDAEGYQNKTLVVENTLNQELTLTCEGSARADFSVYFTIASFPHSANTIGFQTCASYIPFWRMKAQAAVAPTTGSLTIFLERLG